jgi:integrase
MPPRLVEAAKAAVRAAWAPATRRAYDMGWTRFTAWCQLEARQALPASPETVCAFLLDVQADVGVQTIAQCLAAIGMYHQIAGFDPAPSAATRVRFIWKGIRKEKGVRPRNAKAPIAGGELERIVAVIDRDTLIGKRDAALILVGFAMAARRSEVNALHVEHVTEAPGGLAVLIPQSKTDQEGQGATLGIARLDDRPDLCPVAALHAWLAASGIKSGAVFRRVLRAGDRVADSDKARLGMHAQQVARIVKRYAKAAGLNPAKYAGHSLRRGHVTEAYRQGIPEAETMAQTRHQNATMLRKYREEADPVKRGSSGRMKFPKKPEKEK